MSRLGQVVPKTLAILVAVFFLLGAVVTAGPSLFGGSKVRTLFNASEDALAADPPQVKHVARVLDAGAPMVDAGPAVPERPAVYFPASKSMGGVGLPTTPEPTQQAQP